MLESVCFAGLLVLLLASSHVADALGTTTSGADGEGQFPILMPNVHPYRVSLLPLSSYHNHPHHPLTVLKSFSGTVEQFKAVHPRE